MNLPILKQQFLTVSKVLFFSFLLSSCSSEDKMKKTCNPQIMRICIRSNPYTLNPNDTFEAHSQRIVYSLFEGLTRIGQDQKVHLGIAESVVVSPDKTTYTITLKKALWSNGEPISAEDFAYAWKKIIAKESTSQLSNLFYCIKYAREIKEGQVPLEKIGIKVIDERILEVELAHPTPYFLYLLSNPVFAPIYSKIDKEDPQWHQKQGANFICNGPFRLKEKKEDFLFVLEKNPFYYDKKVVQLDELHLYVVDDPNTAFLMFEQGEVDWYGEPLIKIGREVTLHLMEQERLDFSPFASCSWMLCNTEKFPLNSKKIRQAISSIIDRQNFVEHFAIGHKAATGVIPDRLTKLKTEDLLKEQDIARAQALFEEGLRELNIDRDQFPALRLSYTSSTLWSKPFLQYLQEVLHKNLGVHSTLEYCEYAVYFDKLKQGNYDMATLSWISYLLDPIYHLEAFEINSANNWSFWKHQQFQDLVNNSEKEGNDARRDKYLRQAEKILIDELPVIPLSYQTIKCPKNDKVKNIVITDLGFVDFKWASFVGP